MSSALEIQRRRGFVSSALTLTTTMSDRQQLLSMGFGPEVRVDKAIRATGGKGLQAAMDCE